MLVSGASVAASLAAAEGRWSRGGAGRRHSTTRALGAALAPAGARPRAPRLAQSASALRRGTASDAWPGRCSGHLLQEARHVCAVGVRARARRRARSQPAQCRGGRRGAQSAARAGMRR